MACSVIARPLSRLETLFALTGGDALRPLVFDSPGAPYSSNLKLKD